MTNQKRILIVATSNAKLGDSGKETGYWMSEVTHPWKVFLDAGYDVDFVSPLGGNCPVEGVDLSDPINKEFVESTKGQEKISHSMNRRKSIQRDYQAIFYAGGHGVMWDFPENKELAEIARDIYEQGGVVSAVCHGPAGLVNIKLSNGEYLIKGKHINCFSNDEEKNVGMDGIVPFLLESKLVERGAIYEKSDMFQPHVVSNERLVTGQNPMSAKSVAEAVVMRLG